MDCFKVFCCDGQPDEISVQERVWSCCGGGGHGSQPAGRGAGHGAGHGGRAPHPPPRRHGQHPARKAGPVHRVRAQNGHTLSCHWQQVSLIVTYQYPLLFQGILNTWVFSIDKLYRSLKACQLVRGGNTVFYTHFNF